MESRNLVLLGWLAVLTSAVVDEELPSFCKIDCPKYQLVKKYDNFEHRIYEATRWVTTSLNLKKQIYGKLESFGLLFKYISGRNAEGLKINRTVPMVTVVPFIKRSAVNATMSLFLPHGLAIPPTPSDPAVYLENSPSMSVYVKAFGDKVLDTTYYEKAEVLAKELRTLGLLFDDSFYICASFDEFKPLVRHNEVWILDK